MSGFLRPAIKCLDCILPAIKFPLHSTRLLRDKSENAPCPILLFFPRISTVLSFERWFEDKVAQAFLLAFFRFHCQYAKDLSNTHGPRNTRATSGLGGSRQTSVSVCKQITAGPRHLCRPTICPPGREGLGEDFGIPGGNPF